MAKRTNSPIQPPIQSKADAFKARQEEIKSQIEALKKELVTIDQEKHSAAIQASEKVWREYWYKVADLTDEYNKALGEAGLGDVPESLKKSNPLPSIFVTPKQYVIFKARQFRKTTSKDKKQVALHKLKVLYSPDFIQRYGGAYELTVVNSRGLEEQKEVKALEKSIKKVLGKDYSPELKKIFEMLKSDPAVSEDFKKAIEARKKESEAALKRYK